MKRKNADTMEKLNEIPNMMAMMSSGAMNTEKNAPDSGKFTEDMVKPWLEDFRKKLERETSLDIRDRLILSVERMEFSVNEAAGWTKVNFKGEEGTVYYKETEEIDEKKESWDITAYQRKLLKIYQESYDLTNRPIKKSKLQREEEIGWILDQFDESEIISFGGEAVVLKQKIGNSNVAVRVQAFDPAIFTDNLMQDQLIFKIRMRKDYGSDELPKHDNVINHFCNIEIYSEYDKDRKDNDCLGWITIMELCDKKNLRELLRESDQTLDIQKRINIAIGVIHWSQHLATIDMKHFDIKPENICFRDENAKLIDFGLATESKNKDSFREMGYTRKGTKYLQEGFLRAGTAGFCNMRQIISKEGETNTNCIFAFILTKWSTVWTLLYGPIEKEEDKINIRDKLLAIKADWLTDFKTTKTSISKKQIVNQEEIIHIPNALLHYQPDENMEKKRVMANLKPNLTWFCNIHFDNLPYCIVDQKDSNLCVFISVTYLILWALENDLNIGKKELEENYYTFENILNVLTMIVFPRGLSGLNLNPVEEEQNKQHTPVELLLDRLKNESYLNRKGWKIVEEIGKAKSNFHYDTVSLHEEFQLDDDNRPLTALCVKLVETTDPESNVRKEKLIYHQMTLAKIDRENFMLQNTEENDPIVFIPLKRGYIDEFYRPWSDNNGLYWLIEPSNDMQSILRKERMKQKTWFIYKKAWKITLVNLEESQKDADDLKSHGEIKISENNEDRYMSVNHDNKKIFKNKKERTSNSLGAKKSSINDENTPTVV